MNYCLALILYEEDSIINEILFDYLGRVWLFDHGTDSDYFLGTALKIGAIKKSPFTGTM